MSVEGTVHMRLVRRWLRGEVVHGQVEIKIRGGPFDGRFHIVGLDRAGLPPARLRNGKMGLWHVHVLAPDTHELSSWVYRHNGAQPARPPWQTGDLAG
jgi:hypothetical protein